LEVWGSGPCRNRASPPHFQNHCMVATV
jgi:hypothetical protein